MKEREAKEKKCVHVITALDAARGLFRDTFNIDVLSLSLSLCYFSLSICTLPHFDGTPLMTHDPSNLRSQDLCYPLTFFRSIRTVHRACDVTPDSLSNMENSVDFVNAWDFVTPLELYAGSLSIYSYPSVPISLPSLIPLSLSFSLLPSPSPSPSLSLLPSLHSYSQLTEPSVGRHVTSLP